MSQSHHDVDRGGPIAVLCAQYVKEFLRATLPASDEKIDRQPRSLESERPATADDRRADRLPERVITPEGQLLATLGAGTGRRVFVTGDAATGDGGSGKSEFTRQLAYAAAVAASQALAGPTLPLVPIRYELKNLTDKAVLFDRLRARSPITDLAALADAGSLLVILDGLDELRQSVANDFSETLADLLKAIGTCPLVVAGREASLRPDWAVQLGLTPKAYYRLTPFGDGEVESFVRGYFRHDPATADALLAAVRAATGPVAPLLRQPFMLTMVCSGVRGGKVELPGNPIDFFAEGLEQLLHRRSSPRLPIDGRMNLDPKLALDRLGLLAAFACTSDFRFHITDPGFPADRVAAPGKDAAAVLNDLAPHSGILCVQGEGAAPEYSFSNRVVAEYLAGTHIARDVPTVASDAARYGPVTEAADVYVTGERKVEPGSLRFFGRHIWSDEKSNVLRWLARGWRRFEPDGRTINRSVSWLLATLGSPAGDDVRKTLLMRLLDLLANYDDESCERHPKAGEVVLQVLARLPAEEVDHASG